MPLLSPACSPAPGTLPLSPHPVLIRSRHGSRAAPSSHCPTSYASTRLTRSSDAALPGQPARLPTVAFYPPPCSVAASVFRAVTPAPPQPHPAYPFRRHYHVARSSLQAAPAAGVSACPAPLPGLGATAGAPRPLQHNPWAPPPPWVCQGARPLAPGALAAGSSASPSSRCVVAAAGRPRGSVGARREPSAGEGDEGMLDDGGGNGELAVGAAHSSGGGADGGVYYAVGAGRKTGVFTSWDDARRLVDRYSGAIYRKFSSQREAWDFVENAAKSLAQPQPQAAASADPPAADASADAGAGWSHAPPGSGVVGLGAYYAVARGRKVGVMPSWEETRAAVDGCPGSVYKRFRTEAEAKAFVAYHTLPQPQPPRVLPTTSQPAAAAAPTSARAYATETPAPPQQLQPIRSGPASSDNAGDGTETAATRAPAAECTDAAPSGSEPEGDDARHGRGVDAGTGERRTELVYQQAGPSFQQLVVGHPALTAPQDFYAVAHGWKPGIYTSWAEAMQAVDGYSGAVYRKFKRLGAAKAYVRTAPKPRQPAPPRRQSSQQQQRQSAGAAQATTGPDAKRARDPANASGSSALEGPDAAGDGADTAQLASDRRAAARAEAKSPQATQPAPAPSPSPSRPKPQGAPSAQARAQVPPAAARYRLLSLPGLAPQRPATEEVEARRLVDFGSLSAAVDPEREYCLEFDGGSRRNPGDAGFGAVLVDTVSGQHVEYLAGPLAASSNNVAEWSALAAGMQLCLGLGVRRLVVQGDSELVCRQVSGVYGVNHPLLRPLAARVSHLRSRLASFRVQHVSRNCNAVADLLSNVAMDAEAAVAAVVVPAGEDGVEEAEAERRQRRDTLVEHLGPAAVAAALATASASAGAILSDSVLTTTAVTDGGGLGPAKQPAKKRPGRGRPRREQATGARAEISVTECPPPLAALGSTAGSLAEYRCVLTALALAARGLL